jgi:hypothetical protein
MPLLADVQPVAVVAAAVAGLAWLAALAAIRIVRQPREPPAAPPTADLGDEPPALAGLLTSGFEVRREALPATLLDLAARGLLDIEGLGSEARVRLRLGRGMALRPYERRVLELARSRAVAGVIPAPALTVGPRERARSWWRGFRSEVIDDAQAQGLSRDLWDRRVLSAATVGAVVPAGLVLVAARAWEPAAAALLAAIAAVGALRQGRRQRDTPEGLRASARWLGVRRYLREDAAFPELPPASVVVWERYLAYAAAFGVARNAVSTFSLGAEEDRRAWSSLAGRWREVRVRYPVVWPPAWGWIVGVALLASVAGILVAAGLIRLAAAIGWPDPDSTVPPGFVTFLRGFSIVAWTAGAMVALWSIVALVRSIGDLGRTRRVTGQVLRLRTFGRSDDRPGRHYLALDEGIGGSIRAWRVPEKLWTSAPISQYQHATVTVGPFLGRIRSIEPGA